MKSLFFPLKKLRSCCGVKKKSSSFKLQRSDSAHLLLPSHPSFSNQVCLSTHILWEAYKRCVREPVWCSLQPCHSQSKNTTTTPIVLGFCWIGGISLCRRYLPDDDEEEAGMRLSAPDCVKLAPGTSEGSLLYLAIIQTECVFSVHLNILINAA